MMNTLSMRSRVKIIFSASIILTGLCFIFPRATMAAEMLFVVDQFPPYQYLTPDGEARGSSYEVVRAVFERLGMPVKVTFLPWKRAVSNTKKGIATGLFSRGYKKERESFDLYSNPISFATKGVIVRKTYAGPPIASLADLHDLRVGAVAGFAANKFLDKAGISFAKVPKFDNVIPMLANNRFDALYLTLETGQFLAAEAGKAAAFKYVPLKDFALRPYHMCFSKKWPGYRELTAKFNTALGELQANGRFEAIYAKYR
jgi:polar amino acid transport system substrate-binding protein